MKLRLSLITAFLFCSALPAIAGPNGAVFCKDTNQSSTLSAYDISLQSVQPSLLLFQAQGYLGRRTLQMENYDVRGELLAFTEQVTTVRYAKPNGRLAQAMIDEHGRNRIATVAHVQYFNYGLNADGIRTGSVVVKFKEGPTTEVTFKDCLYQGGAVSDWARLWNHDAQ